MTRAQQIRALPKGLSLLEVAKAIGVQTKSQASRICSKYRYKTRGHRKPGVDRKWLLVDWRMQDVAIADIMGCSRERVRKVRLRLKKPPAKNHQRPRTSSFSWDQFNPASHE